MRTVIEPESLTEAPSLMFHAAGCSQHEHHKHYPPRTALNMSNEHKRGPQYIKGEAMNDWGYWKEDTFSQS